jgi:hypothetical protein
MKKGKKKKKKIEAKDNVKILLNPLKEVRMCYGTKQGYGPKKTES